MKREILVFLIGKIFLDVICRHLCILFISVSLFGASKSLFIPPNFNKVNLKFFFGYVREANWIRKQKKNPLISRRSGSLNQSQYFVHDVTQILRNQNFNAKKPTVLYVHGWTQSPDAETSQLLIKAYLKRGDYNILILDWSDYSMGLYSSAMIRISKISRIFGRALLRLFDKGLSSKSFHCVGHSFGAHACGIMGRELFQISNRKHKLGRLAH